MPGSSKLCRACLTATDSFQYSLFENVSPDVYWFCTNIEIAKEDVLPKAICNTCYDLITKFSEFKRTCLQSQNTLLVYYSVAPESKKLDWLNNDPKVVETQNNDLNALVENYEDVTVKVEHFGTNNDGKNHHSITYCSVGVYIYTSSLTKQPVSGIERRRTCAAGQCSDFDNTELPNLSEDTVKENKTHKKVRVKTSNRRKLRKCELCRKSFDSREKFERHKLAHQKTKSLKCTPCKKTFMTLSGLKKHHLSWHERVRLSSVTCRTCGKIVKSRETLRVHQKLHGERSLFICNVCGKGCTTSVILKAHLETHKENRERQFTCEHCGKKFYTNKILMSHVQKCHTDKRYICQVCSYPFTDKHNLAKHLLKHEGKGRLYKCDICNKTFTARSSYVEHQRAHSGERPFTCTYCSKSFIAKRRLIEHNRTHTGEKPHKCSVCEHSFTQRGTLTRHMKVHDRGVPVIK